MPSWKYIWLAFTATFFQQVLFGWSASEPRQFTTGVETCTETESIEWRIQNLFAIVQNETLINQQVIEVTVGASPTCTTTWLIGLRSNSSSRHVDLYFKLLKTFGISPQISTKITSQYKKSTGESGYSKLQNATILPQDEMVRYLLFHITSKEKWDSTYLHQKNDIILEIKIETSQISSYVNSARSRAFENNIKLFDKKFLTKLQDDFSVLLSKDEYTDLNIVCSDGKLIALHSNILSVRCPKCWSILQPGEALVVNRNDTYNMNDVSSATMEILVHYFYTGKLQPGWENANTLWEFILVAKKFELVEILEMLDTVIGERPGLASNIHLLNLVKNVGLHTAESEMVKTIVKRSVAAKNSSDIIAMCP